jgi:hypothetical protein
MTGAEHYAEAERLIEMARDAGTPGRAMDKAFGKSSPLYEQRGRDQGQLEQAAVMLADAQVHATLALAAAGAGSADPGPRHLAGPARPAYCGTCPALWYIWPPQDAARDRSVVNGPAAYPAPCRSSSRPS